MIDDLVTDIAARGWLLNNCYQADSGWWRVNLRAPTNGGDWFTEWSEGPSFGEALEDAVGKIETAEFFQADRPQFSLEPKQTLRSLLKGLVKTQPFERRM